MKLFQPTKQLAFTEFVTLMAFMIALVAVSIDAMLPALPEIGSDLGARQTNDSQLILTWLFIGMALGNFFTDLSPIALGESRSFMSG